MNINFDAIFLKLLWTVFIVIYFMLSTFFNWLWFAPLMGAPLKWQVAVRSIMLKKDKQTLDIDFLVTTATPESSLNLSRSSLGKSLYSNICLYLRYIEWIKNLVMIQYSPISLAHWDDPFYRLTFDRCHPSTVYSLPVVVFFCVENVKTRNWTETEIDNKTHLNFLSEKVNFTLLCLILHYNHIFYHILGADSYYMHQE